MTTTTVQTDTQLASRLRLAVMRLARILRQKAQDQITPSQLSALVSVERDGPVTLGELAALESVQPPTMTRIVVALEEQGLVLREADPADRRIARVHVTTAGRKLLERNQIGRASCRERGEGSAGGQPQQQARPGPRESGRR